MDVPSENTSSLLQMDERYKKLERAVKIIQLMQLDKKDVESSTSTRAMNISSIHGDAFDTSCAFSFKLGSEVVSSSNNMRNLVSHKMKALNKNNNKIATSSIKASPSNDEAKVIMPPPKTIPIFSHLLNKNTSMKSSCSFQETLQPNHKINTETEENNISSTIQPDRIFQRWRVSINDKGQLVIQGKLKDSDKTVKSKPVIRRLSSVMVQSCYNNIYELQGRIYDEQNVLPKYIRGKFYNGFPDDWENVYQLWRSYIAGGCKLTFRWPTPVTDSDDDLQSDITEITYYKVPKKSYDCADSPKNQREKIISLQKHPKRPLEESSYQHLIERVENQTVSVEGINNTNKVSPKRSPNQSIEKNNSSQQIKSFLDQVNNLPVNNSSLENSVINEDISSAVAKIFASRNISIECIDKIIEMFNCYKYVVMANPENSSPRATINNRDSSEKISSVGNVQNFNVTYTNSKINKNCLPHDHYRTYDYVHQNTPTISRKSTSMKNIRTVRKKLSSKDYDSDEDSVDDSECDSEAERKKNEFWKKNFRPPRISSTRYVENKSLNDSAEIVKGYKFKHQSNDESNNDFISKRTKYRSPGHTPLTRSVKRIDDQVNVKHPEVFKKPLPQVQYKEEVQDYGNVYSPSSKHQRQQNQSPSRVTRFLNDSCVSLSEDDQNIKQNYFKLTDKRITTQLHRNILSAERESNQLYSSHYDDPCTSCNESEIVVDNKVKSHDAKKQVLQESNIQFSQPMLDNNMRYSKSKQFFSDMKNKSQSHQETRYESKKERSLLDEGLKELSLDRHAETYANNNKENKLNQAEKKSPKGKVPTIVSVEEVSFDINPQSLKKNYRGKVNKSRFLKEHEIENYVEDDQHTKNCSKISEKNSNTEILSLDLSSRSSKSKSTVQCEDLSIKVKNINNKTKNEHVNQEAKLDKSNKKVIFGSEENPKKLTKWIPKILKKPDLSYGLVFEGDLLNEIGHVESKKFITGFITRRLSPKIIETEKQEFYQLVGDLTDTKYMIPKDLRKLCHDRCPSRISQFCERWRNIILKGINESQALNSTADISQSSRGRRRYPYLSYWTGERVAVKNNEAVYNPGDSSKSTIYSPFNTSKNLKKKDLLKKKDSQLLLTDQNSSNITTKEKEQNEGKYLRRKKEINFDDKPVENRKEMEFSLRSSSRRNNTHNFSKDGHSGTKETVTLEKKNLNNVDNKEKEKSIDKNFNKKGDSNFEDKNVESRKKLRELRSKLKREKTKERKSSRFRDRRISLKDISTSYDSSSEEDHPMSKRRKRDSNNARKNENSLENANVNDKDYKSSKEKSHRKQNDSRINSNQSNEITVEYCKEIPSKKDVDFSNFESSF